MYKIEQVGWWHRCYWRWRSRGGRPYGCRI